MCEKTTLQSDTFVWIQVRDHAKQNWRDWLGTNYGTLGGSLENYRRQYGADNVRVVIKHVEVIEV